MIRRVLTLRVIGIWLTAWSLWAQPRTSAIHGRVLDPQGLPVPGAAVVVRSLERGAEHNTTTDPRGEYSLTHLEPGLYEVQVSRAGFASDRVPALRLTLDREPRLVHRLLLASERASVEVRAEVVMADSNVSGLAGLIESGQIAELPLIGRNYLQLALLQPGVHAARAYARDGNTGFGLPLSVGGSRPQQNSFRWDGVHFDNQTSGTPGSLLGLNLGVEAIREFAVMAGGSSGSAGRSAGGVVHAVTRSGGNEAHGALYYFHRNSAVDARNFFDGARPAAFRRHHYGGSFSGPIRRNRTFVFANLERLGELQARTTTNTTLSEPARAGLLRSGPVSVDPAVRSLLALLPLPNAEVLGDTGLYVFANPARSRESFFVARLDHLARPSDPIFFRWLRDSAQRRDLTNFALAHRRDRTGLQSLVLEHSHIFSPNVINTERLGWTRSTADLGETIGYARAVEAGGLAFLPGAPGPGLVITAGLSAFEGAPGALDHDRSRFDSFQWYEDLTVIRKRHWVCMGASFEASVFDFDSRTIPLGEFTFATLADLLQNRPLRFQAVLPGSDTARRFRQEIFAWYVQDRWLLSPRLTLEASLRHEWNTTPREAQGKLSNLDRLTDLTPRTSGPLFRNPSLRNFAPRAGLAWDPAGDGKTVLRAGYGVHYDLILSHFLLLAGVRNPPHFLLGQVRGPRPGAFPSGAWSQLVSGASLDLRMERLDPAPPQPYVQHWNVSVARRPVSGFEWEAGYVGSHGLNLSTIVEDANLVPWTRLADGRLYFPEGGRRINPAFGMIRNRLFNGHSFYHGLTTRVRAHSGSRFDAQISFTWSKSIDDDSSTFARTDSENSIGIPVDGIPGFNRGLSNHDVRRHLTASAHWRLPGPRDERLAWLRNWRLATIIVAGSGLPFSVTLAYDAARTGTSRPDYRGGQRPDFNGDFRGSVITKDPARWFRIEAFRRPTPGYLGNLGRNTLAGPGWFSADAVLARDFRLPGREDGKLSLRLEAYNLTNQTNLALPGGRRSEIFTATGVREDAGRITAAGPARKFQFGLRLEF